MITKLKFYHTVHQQRHEQLNPYWIPYPWLRYRKISYILLLHPYGKPTLRNVACNDGVLISETVSDYL